MFSNNLSQDLIAIIIRQVLQHLNNQIRHEIIFKKIYFKFLILTEHLPGNKFIPNY